MSNTATTPSDESRNPILGALATERRRVTLAALRDRSGPVSVRDLATQVVADERDVTLVDVTTDAFESVHLSLVHSHLPTLAEVGLVEWDREAWTATTTAHPALDDVQIERILSAEADDWDAVLDCLAERERRIALSVLRDRDDPMEPTALARAVRDHGASDTGGDGADDDTDLDEGSLAETRVCLHHVHLPKLEATGLVSREGDRRDLRRAPGTRRVLAGVRADGDAAGAPLGGHPERRHLDARGA